MLAEKPPISIAVCTVHHGLPVERTMAYPISVGAFTFDHGKHPWWPQGSQKTPGNFEEKKEFCRDSMVNSSGPAVRRWFGPSLFHLGAFWCWKSGVSDFVGCFLIGYGAQTEKNMDRVQHLRQVLTKSVSFAAEKQTGFSNYARDQHAEVLFHGELHGPSNSVSSVEPATVPCCFWTHEGGFGLW